MLVVLCQIMLSCIHDQANKRQLIIFFTGCFSKTKNAFHNPEKRFYAFGGKNGVVINVNVEIKHDIYHFCMSFQPQQVST